MRRTIAAMLLTAAALAVHAEIRVETLPDAQFRVVWDGREVVPPARPGLRQHGPGQREVYDPTTRQTITVTAVPRQALELGNDRRQTVLLGPGELTLTKRDNALVYRETFARVQSWWEVTLTPAGDNGLDVAVRIEVSPRYWLRGFTVDLFDLALADAVGDDANLRRPKATDRWCVPVQGDFRLHYPSGPASFVAAMVLQDANLALGVCRLDVHNVWRPDYNELNLKRRDGRCRVDVDSGWAGLGSADNLYSHNYAAHYRFRFAEPKTDLPAGYLRLADAPELWADYLAELNVEVPQAPRPALNPDRNNIIIMNFFMAEAIYRTPENPNGWLMNHPGWRDDPWEWQEGISSKMSDAEIQRRTGFSAADFGPPVKWIKPFAERSVREMRETKAQAMIVWRTTENPNGKGDQNYIPETHCFHPELEERMPVAGAVRNWDWAVADVTVRTPDGQVVAADTGVLLHAADTETLIQNNRSMNWLGTRQILNFRREHLGPAAEPFLEQARLMGPREKIALKYVLAMDVVLPAAKLVGKAPGDTATLTVRVRSYDREVSRQDLTLTATITGVQRAAIDVWAKTLVDAGQDFGFLIREDMTVGPPWQQWTRGLDYAGDWQYTMIKQRIQWQRARFGDRCRWFYLDVFGDYTPRFVLTMLRADFPDCFFFVEHPNDMCYRLVDGWKWFGFMTDLEQLVSPDALLTILPDRMLKPGDTAANHAFIRRAWNHPNYLLVTHRGARDLVKLHDEAVAAEAE